MKRVIFLDIDGVLNSQDWFDQMLDMVRDQTAKGRETVFNNGILDPAKVAIMNEILERTGAEIVVSSTWRELFEWEDLMQQLGSQGLNVERIVGRTPSTFGGQRGREIRIWLDENPDVAYVAVDDDPSILHLDHTLHTNWFEGLQPEHVDAVTAIFEKQNK